MSKIKTLINSFRAFDLFGIPVQCYFEKKAKYKSIFGASMSFGIMTIAFYFLIKQFTSWMYIEVSTTISSSENYSSSQLLNENRSIEYILDHKNYQIYFIVRTSSDYSPKLNYKQLSKYFSINYVFWDGYDESEMEAEDCNVRENNEFLDLPYDKEDIPENKTNPNRMCVKNPIKMGLLADLANSIVHIPKLMFRISRCQNSTENNFSCASINEIKDMVNHIVIQASIPKTIYNFKNQTSPIKRTYNYDYYSLDWKLVKTIATEVNPTLLYKDNGLFNDDYALDGINYNPEHTTIDFNTRFDDDTLLFEYDLSVSFRVDNYYIRNQKLNDIIGSLGGIINVLISLGGILCIQFNRFLFLYNLIRSAFKFNIEKKQNVKISSR